METLNKTELGIMNELFYRFWPESTRNIIVGGVLGTVLGMVMKRTKVGLFGGIGIAFGLTIEKYDRAFTEVKVTKQMPVLQQSYGVNYFMEKAKKEKSTLFTKIRNFKFPSS